MFEAREPLDRELAAEFATGRAAWSAGQDLYASRQRRYTAKKSRSSGAR